jgi:hypothetical protein
MNYIKTWKEIMLRPSDFYRGMPTTGGYADPLTFAAISLLISTLLVAFISYITLQFGVSSSMLTLGNMQSSGNNFSIFSYVIVSFVFGIVSIFILALIFYLIYRVLGGTGSYEGTVRFISYAYAPAVLVWIPLLGFIAGIYELYLFIVGGMIVHNVSMIKSVIAVLLPIVLIFLLALVAFIGIASMFIFT